jgi:hypothetical protein
MEKVLWSLGKPRTEFPGGHGGTGPADSSQDLNFLTAGEYALSLARRIQLSHYSSPAMTDWSCRRSTNS